MASHEKSLITKEFLERISLNILNLQETENNENPNYSSYMLNLLPENATEGISLIRNYLLKNLLKEAVIGLPIVYTMIKNRKYNLYTIGFLLIFILYASSLCFYTTISIRASSYFRMLLSVSALLLELFFCLGYTSIKEIKPKSVEFVAGAILTAATSLFIFLGNKIIYNKKALMIVNCTRLVADNNTIGLKIYTDEKTRMIQGLSTLLVVAGMIFKAVMLRKSLAKSMKGRDESEKTSIMKKSILLFFLYLAANLGLGMWIHSLSSIRTNSLIKNLNEEEKKSSLALFSVFFNNIGCEDVSIDFIVSLQFYVLWYLASWSRTQVKDFKNVETDKEFEGILFS